MESFDYKRLESLYAELAKKTKAGKAGDLDSKLCIAAGHALDLIDIVNNSDGDLGLDLTADTEEAVPKAVSLVHMANLSSGNTGTVKCKEYIVKKLAGYELFAIYNELLRAEHEADFIVEDGVVKIQAKAADGGPLVFDVTGAMTQTIKDYVLATAPGDGFIAFGTMQPFYDSLIKDFLERLS